MSSIFKPKSKKSKGDTGQGPGVDPPSIRVEETPPEPHREGSFGQKVKEKLQQIISIRPWHSRTASKTPSENTDRKEHLTNATVDPDNGQSGDIKDNLGKHADQQLEAILDKAPEAKVGAKDSSGNLPKGDPVIQKKIDRKALQDEINSSKRKVEGMHKIGGGMQTVVEYGAKSKTTVLDQADKASDYLKSLKLFNSVVKGLANVHPYAQVALSVLSWASQAIINQANRDKAIQDLQARIGDVYEFMLGDGRLDELISMKKVLSHVSEVINECAKFIQLYSHPNFFNRFGKAIFSDKGAAIAKYTQAVDDLMQQFNQSALRNVLITTNQTLEDIRQLGDNQYLATIAYAEGAGLNMGMACLDGTREEIQSEVIDWINDTDPNAPRILWLSGPAGTGKSAIAHSIARAMKDAGALGSCFCFNKGDVKRYTKMFTTISRDLAVHDLRLKQVLASVVSRDRSLCTTEDITQQWENLIKEPLSATSGDTFGRVVIVIDGLDESGDSNTRNRILFLLAKQITDLPDNMRILVTSRPLPDIHKAFGGSPHIKHKSMDDIPMSLTERDIHSYISEQLKDSDDEFGPDEIVAFARKADGLFEWARLACNYVKLVTFGRSQRDRFKTLMSMTSTMLLDEMYTTILKEIVGKELDEEVRTRFRSVMCHVLFMLEPLPLEALIIMHRTIQPKQEQYDAESTVLRHLGSLLSGIQDRFTPIRPLHSSFHDFLIDEKRSGEFFVDEVNAHLDLTLSCLHIMQQELCFNICRLESSYLRNSEVGNLAQRVKQYISPQLSYSCRFLGHHIDKVAFRVHVASVLRDILYTARIFYWIETISFLQSLPILLQCFATTLNWLENSKDYEQVVLAAKEGIKIIQNFGGMISESTPHLYLSVLPFLPQDSIISGLLSGIFPFTAKIVSRQLATWPPFGCLLIGHTEAVESVTFSHDGKWVASGSKDSTIRIWDAEMGLLMGRPLKGHTSGVTSVAFSPDGKWLVSGSRDKTVCVWDTVTGSLIMDPLKGHSRMVWSVAVSPDGENVVSGSSDKTICIWKVKTGVMVGNPLTGHTGSVHCVAFSPDGKWIVSGSSDTTICIWDVDAIPPVCKNICGHEDAIWSVSISCDGTKIVSGSNDGTICIWDAKNGVKTCQLKGHSERVCSLAISPNGEWIYSASIDLTIQTWDIDGGIPIGRPFKPQARSLLSLALTQDGKKIASGSFDNTVYVGDIEVLQFGTIPGQDGGSINSVDISPDGKQIGSGSENCTSCIWDIESGALIKGPLVVHEKPINSVSFSPDGLKIASGSEDSTICIWDATKGSHIRTSPDNGTGRVLSIAFSPDSQQIVSSSDYGKICLWDANSGSQLRSPIQVHNDTVWAVAFSPNGEKIAYGSQDGTVCIWDIESQKRIDNFLTRHEGSVTSVAWSPIGEKIVSCSSSTDNTMIIWDVTTLQGDPLTVTGHTSLVRSAVFSQDGGRIVSCSFDKTIRVWNVNDGQQMGYSLRGHTAFVTSVVFSPSGKLVISGSIDGKIRVWETYDDSKHLKCVKFSSSEKHALCNTDDFFEGVPYLKLDWKGHVGLNDDGWIVGPQARLLLWIPIQLRSLLHTPGTVLIIPEQAVELDLSMMAHGDRWTECFHDGNGNMP